MTKVLTPAATAHRPPSTHSPGGGAAPQAAADAAPNPHPLPTDGTTRTPKQTQEDHMLHDTPEARAARTMIRHTILAATADPELTSFILMEHFPQEDRLPITAAAINHFATTLAYRIVFPQRDHPRDVPDQRKTASGAAMIACSTAVNTVLKWMKDNPAQAQAIEQALNEFVQEHRLDEHHFNHRSAVENAQAVKKAMEQPQPGTDLEGPQKEVIDGLSAIARHAGLEMEESHRTAEGRSSLLYFHDTHYDQVTILLWTRTLLRAIG